MKTRLAVLASALALAAVVGANGCADNLASVQIQAICLPSDDCTFSGECEAQYIGYVTLDTTTSSSDTLWLLLQIENQLPDNGNLATGRLNTNDAHIDETYIEYDLPAGTLGPATIGSNFLVQASGTSVVSVQIPLGVAAPPGETVARVRLRGYYDDGTRFETGEFPIAIRVCASCVSTACAGGPTCPPNSEGQLPLTCVQ